MARGFLGDLRLAVRSCLAAPAVTVAAVLTLTLGIGSTIAIFSIANALSLRPLPVSRPQDLATITSATALRYGFHGGAGWNHGMWDRFRQRADAFDGAFAWTRQRLDLSNGGEMDPVNALVCSGDAFAVLGVPALVGRTFTAADDVRGGGAEGAVAVISYRMWQRRFSGRADVLGSRLLLDRVPVTIVGVAPEWFGGVDVGRPFDVAIPFGSEAVVHGSRSVMSSERTLLLSVMVRLKPGQSLESGTSMLRGMQPDILGSGVPAFLEEPFLLDDASRGLSDRLRQQYQFPLVILSIVAGIVLVIVCLNVANLLLSRASARRSDVAVRLALGAHRWRVARQHLAEALALGTAGTAGGLLFAAWASRAIVTRLPFPEGAVSLDLAIDWRLAAFTIAVAAVVVVLFGTVPAWYAARIAPFEAMREAGRKTSGSAYASSALVLVQVALSIVLLAAASLFVRTSNRLAGVPLGFDPKGMLVVSVNSPGEKRQQILDAVRSVRGVLRAAGSSWVPVGTGAGGLLIDASGRRGDASQRVAYNFVTPGWFSTYATTVKAGRDFDARDAQNGQRVAIVNEALRRALLPGRDALGATIHAGPCDRDGCAVVGVVADAVYGPSLRDAAPPTVYLPIAQSEGIAIPGAPFRISIRTGGDPAGVAAAVRARLRDLDGALAFASKRLEEDLAASVAQERLLAMLSGFFGGIALLLAGVGLYGVTSYAVTRRRAEIGIRLALGGQPHEVVGAIVGRVALFVLAGAVSGLLCTLWLSRFVAPLLYGLEPSDPWTLVAAVASLALVGLAAGWIPASRAARTDPAQTLRRV